MSCLMCVICVFDVFFFFKQKTAYEMRISDWSSDVCSSDLDAQLAGVDDDCGRFAIADGEAFDIVDRGQGQAAFRSVNDVDDRAASMGGRPLDMKGDRKSVV